MLEFCSSLEACTVQRLIRWTLSTLAPFSLLPRMNGWQLSRTATSSMGQDRVRSSVQAVCQQSLKQLQPMMQGMGEQAISHIVWSSIKLGFNPNEHVPGMVDTLTNRYLQLMRVTNKRQRPSEQGAASVLWALATMQHPAATSELVEAVFSFLANLMQHPNVQQRPTAQAVSNVALALPELQHSLKNDRLLHDFCKYMHSQLQSPDVRVHLNAQNVAKVIWALAKLQHSLEDRLLDGL